MSRLQKISEEYNIAVFITNQMTADPGANMSFVADPKKPIDVEFGNLACYFNETFESSDDANHTKADFCKNENTTEAICKDTEYCYWDYSGSGIEYQVLAGPAFIAVFYFCQFDYRIDFRPNCWIQ